MTTIETLTDAIHLLETVRDEMSETGRWRRRWQLDSVIAYMDSLRTELGLMQDEKLPLAG